MPLLATAVLFSLFGLFLAGGMKVNGFGVLLVLHAQEEVLGKSTKASYMVNSRDGLQCSGFKGFPKANVVLGGAPIMRKSVFLLIQKYLNLAPVLHLAF